jgi:hypothetical protein
MYIEAALRVSVLFWVLALDHDLRIASDIIGSVFVRNPAGTKVALWEEVALDEGKKSLYIVSAYSQTPI